MTTFQNWMTAPPVELDPELQACRYHDDVLGWDMVKHPLVFSIMHMEQMNGMLNEQLRNKREALARARAEGSWHTCVWLYERAYRYEGFVQIEHLLSDTEYWELLASVWIDSENIRENADEWEELLMSPRGNRHATMTEGEAMEFMDLPGSIVVYQGHTLDRDDGWSWTTDREKAWWFARRFAQLEGSTACMTRGIVGKSSVMAYLTRRGESEILVNPEAVSDKVTHRPRQR